MGEAAVIPWMQDLAAIAAGSGPAGDAGAADRQIRAAFEPFHGEHIGFARQLEGLPGPRLGGWMHKATHQ